MVNCCIPNYLNKCTIGIRKKNGLLCPDLRVRSLKAPQSFNDGGTLHTTMHASKSNTYILSSLKCVFQIMTSDSQSTSSVENDSPVNRKRRKDTEVLRILTQKILHQKHMIMNSLDAGCTKSHLDSQISVSNK